MRVLKYNVPIDWLSVFFFFILCFKSECIGNNFLRAAKRVFFFFLAHLVVVVLGCFVGKKLR